jgi:SprA-related family
VSIDTSEVPNNPDATISKLETVIRAALAPSDPSAQDRQVAAEAQAKIQKARQEKEQKEAKEAEKTQKSDAKADPGVTASSGPNDASPSSAGKSNPVARATARRDTALAPGTLFNLVA